MRNRIRLQSWAYLLVLGFPVISGIGYLLLDRAPIPVSQFPQLLVCSLLVCLFWILNLQVFLGGITTPVETSPWFLMALFFIAGPSVAFVSFFVGTSVYSLLYLRRPDESKVATIVINTVSYGAAFLAGARVFSFALETPFRMIAQMVVILSLQTFFNFVVGAGYVALAWNRGYWEVLRSFLPVGTFFLLVSTAIVFPGLSYISMVFWTAGFHLAAVSLFVPFLLLRRAMQSALNATEEIVNTIDAIVIVIEAKDPYTHYHCNRVALYSMMIAKFCGLGDFFIEKIGRCARLHDVGKVLVADKVLKKEGGLSEEEYGQIKLHADPDKVLMNQIPDRIPLKELVELGRHHHERFDGKGYPDGLKGEAIPVEVRVISMADAWDAMTSDRVYRPGLSDEKALQEVEKYKGKQWDPSVVEAFMEAYQQDALKEVIRNPDSLRNPPRPWRISPKLLKYSPDSPEVRQNPFTHLVRSLVSFHRPLLFAVVLGLFFICLYRLPSSPLYENAIVLYAALAVLLEYWEMKIPKYPRFYPVEAAYLASLFILPLHGVLALILFGTLVRSLYDWKVGFQRGLELFHRLILFSLSVSYFKWMGFGDGGRLFIANVHRESLIGSVQLAGVFSLWAVLYATARFFMARFETLVERRSFRLLWYFPALKYSALFSLGLVAPFGFILSGFRAVASIHFPYLMACFTLVLLFSYPLLDYFRRIVLGNARTLEALAGAVDQRFPSYHGHSKRVTELSLLMAKLLGMCDEEMESLELAGRIFGIGNVGVPDEILNKPGPHTEEEMRIMRQHVEISGQIAAQYSLYKEEVPIIWSHHERVDGNGYPSHLQGKAIPLGARILTVADAYYAMISDRPYPKGVSSQEAISRIKADAGTHFDPDVVDAFLQAIEK